MARVEQIEHLRCVPGLGEALGEALGDLGGGAVAGTHGDQDPHGDLPSGPVPSRSRERPHNKHAT